MTSKNKKPNISFSKAFSSFVLLTAMIYVGTFAYKTFQAPDTEALVHSSQHFREYGRVPLATVGVALATNIGTFSHVEDKTKNIVHQDILFTVDAINDRNITSNDIIGTHMPIIDEYQKLLQIDVRNLLNAATNRAAALDAFIDQLQLKKTLGLNAIQTLQAQLLSLASQVEIYTKNVSGAKQGIINGYASFNPDQTHNNLNKYLENQESVLYARTYSIFIQKFVSAYSQLNAFNENLLSALTANREALIKNATVVVPTTGTQTLQDLDLLIPASELN